MVIIHTVQVFDAFQDLLKHTFQLGRTPVGTIVYQAHQVMRQVLKDHVDLELLPVACFSLLGLFEVKDVFEADDVLVIKLLQNDDFSEGGDRESVHLLV